MASVVDWLDTRRVTAETAPATVPRTAVAIEPSVDGFFVSFAFACFLTDRDAAARAAVFFRAVFATAFLAGRLAEDRLAEDRLADDRLVDDRLVDDRLVEDRLAEGRLEGRLVVARFRDVVFAPPVRFTVAVRFFVACFLVARLATDTSKADAFTDGATLPRTCGG